MHPGEKQGSQGRSIQEMTLFMPSKSPRQLMGRLNHGGHLCRSTSPMVSSIVTILVSSVHIPETCKKDRIRCPCRWPIVLPNVNVLGFLQQKGSASAAQQGKICFPPFLTLGGPGLASSAGAIPGCLTLLTCCLYLSASSQNLPTICLDVCFDGSGPSCRKTRAHGSGEQTLWSPSYIIAHTRQNI